MLSRITILLFAIVIAPTVSNDLVIKETETGVFLINVNDLEERATDLRGNWEFYPNELYSVFDADHQATAFIKVPSWWTEDEKSNVQFATYRIRVIVSNRDARPLAISMPEVYCSYNLFVNGDKIGSNGIVAESKSKAQPQWKPETYTIVTNRDTLEIIIQLSNFYHDRMGINKPIRIGLVEHLLKEKDTIETSNLILLFGLGLLASAALIAYVFHSRDTALLLYSFLCFSWILRSAFSNHYQIVQWFPNINWYWCVRIEYISIYLATLSGSLLVGKLFPHDVNNAYRLFFLVMSVCFTLFTLIVSPIIFTSFVHLYLGLSMLLLISILVIVAKAYMESRKGADFITSCAVMAVIIFGYVILSYEGFFELHELAFNIGFLLMFLLSFIAVTLRVWKMKNNNDIDMMTFDEATKPR